MIGGDRFPGRQGLWGFQFTARRCGRRFQVTARSAGGDFRLPREAREDRFPGSLSFAEMSFSFPCPKLIQLCSSLSVDGEGFVDYDYDYSGCSVEDPHRSFVKCLRSPPPRETGEGTYCKKGQWGCAEHWVGERAICFLLRV